MFELNERELVKKICEDLLSSKITNYNDIQSLWQRHEIHNKFLDEVLDSISEFLVGMDIYDEKGKLENSYEYLCIYVAYQLLSKVEDLDKAYTIYKKIFQIKDLTKGKADEYILNHLEIRK